MQPSDSQFRGHSWPAPHLGREERKAYSYATRRTEPGEVWVLSMSGQAASSLVCAKDAGGFQVEFRFLIPAALRPLASSVPNSGI